MTNLDLIKEKLMKVPANKMAAYIDEVYFVDDNGCKYCAYDNKTCSGNDCIFGITKWLERKVDRS